MGSNTIRMKGVTTSSNSEEILSNFMLALENGLFKDIQLVTTREEKDKESKEFEIKCWVD
jgi:hypothetical protein